MKKILLSALATFLTLSHCFSQDIITKSTAEDLRAKVIEITTTEIKYKMFDNPNGPLYTILKSDVFMIRYENGFKEIFQATQSPKKASTSSNDLARQARQDANNYYTGRNSGAGWTGATTTLLGPLFGLIPAISCSNAEPINQNLNYKDQELMKDFVYSQAYTQEALKIKKRKIWTSYGIGVGAWFLLIVTYATQQTN